MPLKKTSHIPPSANDIDEFCYVAGTGDMMMTALLLSTYGDAIVNAKEDRYQMTALGRAARYGHLDIMQLLLNNGADIDKTCGSYECTPLAWAAFENFTTAVDLLLKSGAATDIRDSQGRTPAVFAEEMGSYKVSKIIAEWKPSPKKISAQARKTAEEQIEKLKSLRPPHPALKKNPGQKTL